LSAKIKKSHTIVHPTGKKGVPVCSTSLGTNPENHDNYYKIIPYLKREYKLNEKSPFVLGNKKLSATFNEFMTSPSQEFYIDDAPIFGYNPGTNLKQKSTEAKFSITHPENNNLRQLTHDKRFSLGDDTLSSKMGIYLIAVNNVPEDGEYGYLNGIGDWKGQVSDSISFDRPSRPIMKHQGNNLLIEHVYKQFYEYCMEHSTKKNIWNASRSFRSHF
jgi:hypothetical protein